jgi:hypothetical protein
MLLMVRDLLTTLPASRLWTCISAYKRGCHHVMFPINSVLILLFDVGEASHSTLHLQLVFKAFEIMKCQAANSHRKLHRSRAQEAPNTLKSKRSNTPRSDARPIYSLLPHKKIQVFFYLPGIC